MDTTSYVMFVIEFVIDAEEEKHIAAVQKAMEERGMLDHTIVHGVFVGPARSGKNSLMERLLGRMPSSVSPSTGVAESVVQVKVIQKSATFAANVEESIWSIMDYDDEAIKLLLVSSDSRIDEGDPQQDIQNYVESQDEVQPTDRSRLNLSLLWSAIKAKCLCSCGSQIADDSIIADSEPSLQKSIQSATPPQLPDSYVSPMIILKGALRNKGLEALQQHFEKTWSLYLTNTGGQMEFQEVLPLLVSGPSMFFFTFRLDRDLNEHYVIEYNLSDGTNAKPYTSSLTTIDGILQTLATISAMGTFVYKGIQKSRVPLRPKVFLIGTHKDKLDSETACSQIARIDQQLQEIIKSTSHYKHLVEFASPSQLIFAVNNFSESDTDFKDIRSAVERVILRDELQMTSPAHWLIFSLAIRNIKPYVISYDVCLEIAKKCGLADDEFNEALIFIHSKMGLIRYFPYEDVKDLVVIHPQFLFDKVTELIVNTFTFEKVGKYTMDIFKQKGIFSLSEFESISSRSNASIKPFQFSKLLERLRIAAPFQMDGNRMYFFPCVLAHTPKAPNLHGLEFGPIGPHLMVTFKCGFCPKGLAGALIKYLMANEMESSFTWTLHHGQIFRNQVTFKVGPFDMVVLKISSTHLEIILLPKEFRDRVNTCPLSKVCSEVCEAVEAGIRQVTSDINYIDAQHSLTFPCGCKGDHPGVLEFVGGVPLCISCSKTDEQYPLPTGYKLWQIEKHAKSESEDPEQNSTGSVAQPQTGQTSNSGEGVRHPSPLQGGIQVPQISLNCPPVLNPQSMSGATSGSPQQSESLSLTNQPARLTEIHYASLLQQFSQHAAKWREIGTYLGFKPGELDNIEQRPLLLAKGPTSLLSVLLSEWLQWAPGDSRGSTSFATLEGLKTALREAGLGAAAHDLAVQTRI